MKTINLRDEQKLPNMLNYQKHKDKMMETHSELDLNISDLTPIPFPNLIIGNNDDLYRTIKAISIWDSYWLPHEVYIYMFVFVFGSIERDPTIIEQNNKFFVNLFNEFSNYEPLKNIKIFFTKKDEDFYHYSFIKQAIVGDQTDLIIFFNDLKMLNVKMEEYREYYMLKAIESNRLELLKYFIEQLNWFYNGRNEIIAAAQYGNLDCLTYLTNRSKNKMNAIYFLKTMDYALRDATLNKENECVKFLNETIQEIKLKQQNHQYNTRQYNNYQYNNYQYDTDDYDNYRYGTNDYYY